MHRLAAVVVSVAVGFASVLAIPANAAGAAETGDTPETDDTPEIDGLDVSVTRYGGADRYATSLLIAEAVAADAGGSLEWVVLVSGERWTDAVVAAPVAGALGAPVLMTPPGELRPDAAEFLHRTGVSNALVVGPDASGGAHGPGRGVTPAVLEALEDVGVSAERIAGADRYSTGVAAAGRVTPGVMPELGRTVIVASGEVFADALVAGPFAAHGGHPVLLTPPEELHPDVAAYLAGAAVEHVVIMGGTAALSETVETSITELGASVTRLAGTTRYDTAVKAAELVTDRYSATAGQTCFATGTIGMARARVPFDSFSAAPMLARLCAPLVLADPAQIPADTAAYLDAAREANTALDLRVFGGDAAVSQAAIEAYLSGEDAAADEADGEADEEAEDETEAAEDQDSAEPGVLPAGSCGGSITDEPRLLISSRNAEDPAWSPDCSQVVYTQDGALWIANNNGSNAERIVRDSSDYLTSAAWSPDGTQIVYAQGFQEGDRWLAHIWIANADGTGREKLTHDDISDRIPRWSPDGELIIFDRFTDGERFVARMNRAGKKEKALTPGGVWDFAPVFSPDGAQLAYVALNTIVIADADASNQRRVIGDVYWNGGLDWSPDGKRLAFVRNDGVYAQLIIADNDGLNEELVFEYEGQVLAPRWSPDGQLIVFHTIDSDGAHQAYVSGASGERVVDPASECRPQGVSDVTAGFPLPRWAAPSTGTLRVAVLFMDFPDAEAAHTTEDEAEQGLPYAEDYLESVSYGHLDVELVPHHAWIRSEHEFSDFVSTNALNNQAVNSAAISHAIGLAEPDFDFSDFHTVMVVLPSSHFGGGGFAHPSISAAGSSWPSTLINSVYLGDERQPYTWGSVASHELGHNLGLADLYPYNESAHGRPEAPSGQTWVASQWGRMSMWAYFLAHEDDPRLAHDWNYPDGNTSTGYRYQLRMEEMLAWSRWQLGWLNDSQVSCVNEADVTVTLTPVAEPGDGTAMAAVPLSAREMIVVESRRKLGYDVGKHYRAPDTDASTTFPRLVTEGVLVYTVDSLQRTGTLPLKIAGDSGNGQVDDFPILEAGESVTLAGYTITVTADDGDTHTVTISRNG